MSTPMKAPQRDGGKYIAVEADSKSSLSTSTVDTVATAKSASAAPHQPFKRKLPEMQSTRVLQNPEDRRELRIMDHDANAKHKFSDNYVSTSKYTTFTFIPKALFEQFRRIANVYFLIISVLQVGTDLSPTSKFATIVPLMGVISMTMVKEGIEDYRRHKADTLVNTSTARVVDARVGRPRDVLWAEVRVGDILELADREAICADGILLSTCTEQGLAYIETSSLDGETNLKIRQSLPPTMFIRECRNLRDVGGSVLCENPNANIYRFQGSCHLEGTKESISVSNKNLLLRGAFLRNTKKAYMLVVYTGPDTKQIRNTRNAPSKRSNVDRLTNHTIFLVFLTLFVMCLISTIFFSVWVSNHNQKDAVWYLPFVSSGSNLDNITSFITFLILFNNLVPISLYVSLEMVKLVQANLIASDVLMFYEKTNTPALARTSNLNEDLGQIEYVFSDKTGTLTRNEMVYRRCSVAGSVYDSVGAKAGPLKAPPQSDSMSEVSHEEQATIVEAVKSGERLSRALRKTERKSSDCIRNLLRIMSVCHTVIPEKVVSKGRTFTRLQAASPDEEALVRGAKGYGYELSSRDDKSITIRTDDGKQKFEILNINEFTSARKCMSMIVRTPEGKLELYCKGADDVIFARLRPGQKYLAKVTHHLKFFGIHGLRTLVFARTGIDEAYYKEWSARFNQANQMIEGKNEALEELATEIETDFELVGATAIEDRLQDGVPEAIETMFQAGIKVWVLTGDKIETAINIGLSCNLLKQDMVLMRLEVDDESAVDHELDTFQKILATLQPGDVPAMVVDGRSLTHILDHKTRSKLFFNICRDCQAVIACRVSPRQKASVIRMVKRFVRPQPMTLAIGDGANDVAMIQEAHIGIGISGNEGMQAVRSSDYAIAQFRFIVRLLLVHGNWNYRRVTTVILYSFYKNIANVLTLFYYCIYNGYSGTSLYESWISAGWNVGWTFFPVIAFGITDKDLHAATIRQFPQVYRRGQKRMLFNLRVMAVWVFNAVIHSLIVFFLAVNALEHDVSSANGHTHGIWTMGTIVNGCMVILVNYKIALESQHWTRYHLISIVGSVIFWFFFVFIYSYMVKISFDFFMVGPNFFARPLTWLIFALVPASAIIFDLSSIYLRKSYYPDPVVIASELQKMHGYYDVFKSNQSGSLGSLILPANEGAQRKASLDTFDFSSPTFEAGTKEHGEKEYDQDIAEPDKRKSKQNSGHKFKSGQSDSAASTISAKKKSKKKVAPE